VAALSAAQRRGPGEPTPTQAALGRLVAGAVAASSPPGAAAAPATAPAPAAAHPPAPVDPRVQLDAAFLAERADPAWTGGAGRLAEARIGGALPPGSALRALECRASLCRIETEHPDLPHYRQFFQRAFIDQDSRAWNGAVTTAELTEAGDGSVHVISYLAREGAPLPQGGPRDGALAGKP
jgi:hypothetical protein